MKITLSLVFSLFLIVASQAQTRNIEWPKCRTAFDSALRKTQEAYPYISTDVITEFESGKAIRTTTWVSEYESPLHSRAKITFLSGERKTYKYQVILGFDDYYCSEDGIEWNASKSGCFDPIFALPRSEFIDFSVTETTSNGKDVKVFREYETLARFHGPEINMFRDTVVTVDLDGFLLTREITEGIVTPKTITRTHKQSWITQTKIKPIAAPKRIVNK